ncbi:MAG: hypothetical protein ACLFQA_02055 [Bacteroidales bacterium]
MKRSLFLIFTLLMLSSGSYTFAQTLESILERHFAASGQDQLSEVSTVRSYGKAEQLGMEVPFLQIQKRPNMIYLELDIDDTKMIQTYDGEAGWAIEPWEQPGPRELVGPELDNLSRLAGIDSDLVDWEENGYILEYEGKEPSVDGEVYILKLRKNGGETYRFFIDSESYMINRMVAENSYEGNIVEGETILSDYRDIEGIKVPFKIEVRYGGQTLMTNVMDTIDFNVDIEDDYFSRPAQ